MNWPTTEIRKAMLILRSFDHNHSMQILQLLADNGEMIVTDIYRLLRIEQSVASQRLAWLRKAGVVEFNKNGKYVRYSINSERLDRVVSIISKMAAMYRPLRYVQGNGEDRYIENEFAQNQKV